MTEITWTEERIAKLRKMYEEKHSFSDIAKALGGGISRNAAIGKAHRIGLSGNKNTRGPAKGPTAIREPKRPTAPGVGAAVQKINAAKVAPVTKVKPEPFVLQCAEIVPLNIGLLELAEGTCRYPYGDDTITFCGHPADGTYCPAHQRIAYAPRHGRAAVHPTELGKARGGIFRRTA